MGTFIIVIFNVINATVARLQSSSISTNDLLGEATWHYSPGLKQLAETTKLSQEEPRDEA